MAIDLNNLPIEAASEVEINWDNYQDPQEFAPPIPEGTFNFKSTKIEIEKFEGGVVSFLADHEAYDLATGAKVGALNFDRFSTKIFNRGNPPVPASMAADQLRAAGITARPRSPREWGEQVLSIKSWCDQGNFWQGVVKWDGYCSHKDTQFETQVDGNKKPLAQQTAPHALPFSPRGASQFPAVGTNGSQQHQPVMPCPVCGQEVQARAKLSRRIPK